MASKKVLKCPNCPNCGHELKFILNEWVCLECEYHSKNKKPTKEFKGSFR